MSDIPPRPPVALEQARERAVRELSEHFALDHLDERQLESRLDRAYAATTLQELREVVADLAELRAETGSAVRTAPVEQVREQQVVVAILGGASRKGSWVPPRQLNVFALMGGAELDFREARFGSGEVEVNVLAIMGGVEITVPPGVRVEVDGVAIMGGFEQRAGAAAPPDPAAPLVRIGGFAMMGGVEVRTRLPGESRKEAHRRERVERREMRRLRQGD